MALLTDHKAMTDHKAIMRELISRGYQAYVVGGAVRDIYLGLTPKDYDLTTDALPDELLQIFEGAKEVSALFHDVVYVSTEVGLIEVATMREDGPYSDGRRPDYVTLTKDVKKDLARRDFTCNAMAMDYAGNVIDLFGGIEDLENKILRAVGDAETRLTEHPSRILRALRFSSKFGLNLNAELFWALNLYGPTLAKLIPAETVGKEVQKGLDGEPKRYLIEMFRTDLLEVFLPDIYALAGVKQNKHHNGKDVLSHTLDVIEHSPKGLARLAALLHDVGKSATQQFVDDEYGYSFLGHEEVGAEIADKVCRDLRLTSGDKKLVVTAVREHMSTITSPRTARRFLQRCGDASGFTLDLMEADRSDRHPMPVEVREFVENEIVKGSALKVTDLAINGQDVMRVLNVGPGKRVGEVLNNLLDLVINEPESNTREKLLELVRGY